MSDTEKLQKAFASFNRKKLLDRAYDVAYRFERDYHGCSQATVGALQEVLGDHFGL